MAYSIHHPYNNYLQVLVALFFFSWFQIIIVKKNSIPFFTIPFVKEINDAWHRNLGDFEGPDNLICNNER